MRNFLLISVLVLKPKLGTEALDLIDRKELVKVSDVNIIAPHITSK